MSTELDFADLQGLVTRGYGSLPAACYLMLEITNPDQSKNWLDGMVNRLTTAETKPAELAINLAMTSSGLTKLGLNSSILEMFSYEFVAGITNPHSNRILGDVEESSPDGWKWGGPANGSVDILLMMFALNNEQLDRIYQDYSNQLAQNGLKELIKLETVDLGGVEHFGFRDGISQPLIEGIPQAEPDWNTIKAGEFILGYPNEYGLYTERPLVKSSEDTKNFLPLDKAGSGMKDLGRNGSYLVFRQLRQDVRGFWQFVEGATRNSDGSTNQNDYLKLASKMVGRWLSGASLLKAPDQDDPSLSDFNDFGYYLTDPLGLKCPLGSHVRRANPRDSLDPQPGTDKSLEINKRHRLLRRGREYGKPLDPSARFESTPPDPAEEERGLHFICLNANIARQFEFIQHTWLNNPNFQGLYNDPDPLLGDGGNFTVPARPVRTRVTGLPRFITVKGGGYFFLPGLRAIKFLTNINR